MGRSTSQRGITLHRRTPVPRPIPFPDTCPIPRSSLRLRPTLTIVLTATTVTVFGCGPGTGDSGEWTAEEREAVEHLVSGLEHLRRGILVLNEAGAEGPTDSERERAVEHLRLAQRQTAGIGDSVLAKIHPELPVYFRSRLRRGIDDRIRSLEGAHPFRFSSAVTRLGQWAEWYTRTRGDWNLPGR